MTKKDLNNWFMYHEIHHLQRLGFSSSRIARYFVMDVRTVSKYLKMSEEEFEQFLSNTKGRKKLLSDYESFVTNKLKQYEDTSAAQIHDWLKEAYSDFPEVSVRTVYNFVMYVRQKYNIPFVKPEREFFPVEELPYGLQAQVDFGEYNMRTSTGTRKKVHFFAMVLSRSRMKYTIFLDIPFTSQSVIKAHEKAFAFFDGVPQTIVYDQDRTLIVEENLGDYILTSVFRQYVKARGFKLHFCKKSDPQSKGKVENVIGYIKKNFLYNRPYYDIEDLNLDALAWLGRTANHLEHNVTKKKPEDEFSIEKQYLNPYSPIPEKCDEMKKYTVRKNNSINYKSNFYSLPTGTYTGSDSYVQVKEEQGFLQIYSLSGELICEHRVCLLKGQTITNNNHRRDTSISIKKLIEKISDFFTDKEKAKGFLNEIKKKYPRYSRDHFQSIHHSLIRAYKIIPTKVFVDKTLDFCINNSVFNAKEFEQVLFILFFEYEEKNPQPMLKLLNEGNLEKAGEIPQTSNIEDYEKIINK